MIETLRVLLDETILIAIAVGAFIWLVRRRPTRAVIAALLLLVIFDLGRYYMLSINRSTTPMNTSQAFKSTPNVFPAKNNVLDGKIYSTYMFVFGKTPVLDMVGNNMVEFKDHFQYIARSRQFLLENKGVMEVQRRVRLVRGAQWDEFVSARPQSLAGAYEPPSSSVRPLKFEPDEVSFEVSAGEPAYLYYQDNFDKGWSATLDGAPARLIDAAPYKAVLVGAGTHSVTMSYRPAYRWAINFSLHLFLLGSGLCGLILYKRWTDSIKAEA